VSIALGGLAFEEHHGPTFKCLVFVKKICEQNQTSVDYYVSRQRRKLVPSSELCTTGSFTIITMMLHGPNPTLLKKMFVRTIRLSVFLRCNIFVVTSFPLIIFRKFFAFLFLQTDINRWSRTVVCSPRRFVAAS